MINNSLNNLAVKYKETKDPIVLEQIFKILSPLINKKATYIFYRKVYCVNKKYFRLYTLGILDLDDIKEEIRIFILTLLNKTDIKRPFDKYLHSSIWKWGNQFRKLIEKINCTDKKMTTEDDYMDIVSSVPPAVETIYWDKLELTKVEKQIFDILKKDNEISQLQLSKILGITQGRISQLMKKLRKKIKKYLTQ